MHLFRGKAQKVGTDYFAQVLEPPTDGTYAVNALIPLGHMPRTELVVQQFVVVDGKAYPASGPVDAVPRGKPSNAQNPSAKSERWGWQKEALDRWSAAGHIGIIEAVTGSGKTFLAMEAWRRLLKRHSDTYTLVVVPSITLQEQWVVRLEENFPGKRIARLGNGHHESFRDGKICVAVVNSVVGVGRTAPEARLLSLFEHCRRHRDNRSFLIADECHHYIEAEVFKRVRTLVKYNAVLGLSATVGAHFQVQGLGKIVYSYTFADAVRRGDLPPLTLLNVRCQLHADERKQYQSLSDSIREQADYVQRLFAEEFAEDDFSSEDFWLTLKRLDRQAGPEGEPAIRKLMVLLFKRSAIVYQSREKQSAACTLIRDLLSSPQRRKVIVFFERIVTAEESAERVELEAAQNCRNEVAARGLWTGIIHSGLDDSERRAVLDEFRRAERGIFFACRMLDEGFDVPDVDAAVLVASTKSKRQRVQRIGRVLRRGDGKKQPVVLTLFCDQTTDHLVVAKDRELFGEQTTIHKLCVNEAQAFLGRQKSA